jgi:hypothetical protein
MKNPAWLVAAILFLISVLMFGHLWMLFVFIEECDTYANILFERLRDGGISNIPSDNDECNSVEEVFAETVAQYLTVFLSLLGGSAISVNNRKDGQ